MESSILTQEHTRITQDSTRKHTTKHDDNISLNISKDRQYDKILPDHQKTTKKHHKATAQIVHNYNFGVELMSCGTLVVDFGILEVVLCCLAQYSPLAPLPETIRNYV